MTRPLEVRYRSPHGLRPDPGNARVHPKAQIAQLRASITQFGFTNPVLIDEASGVIAGHGRLAAALDLGLDQVPTIELAGLSEAQQRALRLADNRIALGARWDQDALKLELGALADLDVDLSLTGFGFKEIEVALATPTGVARDEGAEVWPDPPAEPRAALGQIWQLGDHRLGCGHVADAAFARAVMGAGVAADAAFLAPPQLWAAAGEPRQSAAEVAAALRADLESCVAVSRPGAVHFVRLDWQRLDLLSAVGRQVYGDPRDLCVWTKGRAGVGVGTLYEPQHGLVYVFQVGEAAGPGLAPPSGRARPNVWRYEPERRPDGAHLDGLGSTLAPKALIADALQDVTQRGQVVLDAYVGTGTSLLATDGIGRRLRGFEPDPAHLDWAIQRWEQQTGAAAVLAESRQSLPQAGGVA